MRASQARQVGSTPISRSKKENPCTVLARGFLYNSPAVLERIVTMLHNKNIDNGEGFDWGLTSADYAKYRDIYPAEVYRQIIDLKC